MVEHITKEFLDSIKTPSASGKKLNYLMVMPRIATREDMTYQLPYGFCMVTAALKASGRPVYTLNLNYKKDIRGELERAMEEHDIHVVATGGLSGQYAILREVTDAAKEIRPDAITWVGGGIITAEPLVALEALETADYGMIGEGEITINELAYALENGIDPRCVPGVVVHGANYEKEQWTLRPEIKNLDMLPFPDYDGFDYYQLTRDHMFSASGVEEKTAIVTTGRSCPFNCTFCFHSSGKKYRKRSIENVFEEIDWIINRYDIRRIMFIDELFASNSGYLKELTKGVKERNIQYWVQTRVDMISEETLQCLKDTGCYEVTFGVESADDRVLKSMQKHITVRQIEQAFDWAAKVGLPAKGYIIFGDLLETEETIYNSITWWKNHPGYDIRLWWILTFPGSYLYQVACERGMIPNRVQFLRENNTQLNLTGMSDETYWKTVQKVELYQMLVSDGADIDFNEIDHVAAQLGDRLRTIPDETEVAVWPATLDNLTMLEYVAPGFIHRENVCWVNVNPNDSFVLGSEQKGKKIYTPDQAFVARGIETVLYAFGHRSSGRVYEQIRDMVRQYYPSVRRLAKLTDLLRDAE